MKTRRTGRSAGVALAAAALLVTTACASTDSANEADADALRVGLLFSKTGPAAPFGISERNGAWSVLTQANEDGGVNGVKIEIFEADDKSDPTEAAQEARKLILEDKVHVLIGTSGSGSTLAFSPIAAQHKIPVLATAGAVDVTSQEHDFWPWIFRSGTSDNVALEAVFEQLVAEGHEKIGVFAEETPYGDQSVSRLKKLVEAEGSTEIVAVAGAASTATDFSAQATRLRNADPDVVVLVTAAPALGAGITRAIRQDGSDVPIWGSQGLAQDGYLSAAGKAAEGVRMPSPNNWTEPDADTQALSDLLEKYGYEGTSFESAGAHGAQFAVAAAEKVDGEYTGQAMRDALTETCLDTHAIGGEVCYTEEERDGIQTDGFVLLQIKDGKFTTYAGSS